jgi:hypothetical protein
MMMKKEVSPVQAVIAIVVTIGLVGGIWWFAKGRGPAPANPQEVEKMLQQNPSAAPPNAPIK